MKSFFFWLADQQSYAVPPTVPVLKEREIVPLFPLDVRSKDELQVQMVEETKRFLERKVQCTETYAKHIKDTADSVDSIVLRAIPQWIEAMGNSRLDTFICRIQDIEAVRGVYKSMTPKAECEGMIKNSPRVYDHLFLTSMKKYLGAHSDYVNKVPVVYWYSDTAQYRVNMYPSK